MLLRDKYQARSGSLSSASPIAARSPNNRHQGYPTIDLFADPGGLGEGFASALDGKMRNRFQSVVSIEREEFSHKTLLLRHFFRHFPRRRMFIVGIRGDLKVRPTALSKMVAPTVHPGCRNATSPTTRVEFWREKFDGNVRRDARNRADLKAAGWAVVTVRECEMKADAKDVVRRLSSALRKEV